MIDLTPSAIATKLMTAETTAADRAIVEAMAEKALAVVHECGHPGATMIAIERAMVSAARQVIAQHGVRVERLLAFLKSDDDEGLDLDIEDTEEP